MWRACRTAALCGSAMRFRALVGSRYRQLPERNPMQPSPSPAPSHKSPNPAPAVAEAPLPPAHVEYGEFGIRALAQVVDTLVGIALGLVGGILAAIVLAVMQAMGSVEPGWETRIQAESGLSAYGFSLLATALYHAISEGLGGASVGKLLCGLRVLSEDRSPARFGGTLIRSIAFLVDGLFFGLVAHSAMKGSPMNQRLGDQWGHTIVVRVRTVPASSRRGGGLVALGILAGLAVGSLILAVSTARLGL
jgi:uncharacterized RDD family membrane protein YckC